MNKNITYRPANSLFGRQVRQAKGAVTVGNQDSTLTPEQIAWNKEVERKKQLKKGRE